MFRFLPQIFLVQLITAGLVIAAFKWSHDLQLVIVIGLFALIVSILACIDRTRYTLKDTLTGMQEHHAREREEILITAEREKAAIVIQSHQQIERETKRARAKANFKVGVAFSAAAVAGVLMLLTQFVTVELMILVASGSALAGYLARTRHERLARNKQNAQQGTAH